MTADDPRLTAMALIAEVYSGLKERLLPSLTSEGVSEVEFDTLLRLSRTPRRQLRMTELAARANLTSSGMTRVIDRLQARDLVRREADPADRRAAYAALTAEGLALVDRLLPVHLENIERWFTGLLASDELEGLLDALRVIRGVVRPGASSFCCVLGGE